MGAAWERHAMCESAFTYSKFVTGRYMQLNWRFQRKPAAFDNLASFPKHVRKRGTKQKGQI